MFDLNKKEKPFTSFSGFGGGGLGLAGGAISAKTYVDDVFSTFLYEGNGTSQTINNGIDLSGEGGLVWIKNREYSGGSDHIFTDTERGTNTVLESNRARAAQSKTDMITSFNSNGFAVADNGNVNENNDGHVAWTFRKAKGFFDIVTWSGTNTNRDIAHNLGSVPGMVIVKRTDSGDSWYVYHRSHGATKYLELNLTGTGHTSSATWNNTTPTSSVFTVGSFLNANGATYVAYVFAHDDQSFGTDEDEAIIKCGSVTGDSNGDFTVDLGFEPQWILTKWSNATGNWTVHDTMRGFGVTNRQELFPNTNGVEVTQNNTNLTITSTGFVGDDYQQLNKTLVYIAIRRPNKPPETAVGVFDLRLSSTDTSPFQTSTSVLADLVINFNNPASGSVEKYWVSRLAKAYQVPTTAAEVSATAFSVDHNTGFVRTNWWGGTDAIDYTFRRAPGFFDVVAYSGTGSARNIIHNLGVAPELAIIKSRSAVSSWIVGSTKFSSGGHLVLDEDGALEHAGSTTRLVYANWSSTVLGIGSDDDVNASGAKYIAYLFATLPGVFKIGTFSGTGNNINVDCGFTAGARFVMIKRTDSSGDWIYWDTLRGIVSGNESAFPMNGQSTNGNFGVDWIDPLNAGFTVTSSAPVAINTSGGTYLFIAIA